VICAKSLKMDYFCAAVYVFLWLLFFCVFYMATAASQPSSSRRMRRSDSTAVAAASTTAVALIHADARVRGHRHHRRRYHRRAHRWAPNCRAATRSTSCAWCRGRSSSRADGRWMAPTPRPGWNLLVFFSVFVKIVFPLKICKMKIELCLCPLQ